MTLDRERTRDSIDGRQLECWCWGSFGLYYTVERKIKVRRLLFEPRTKCLREKKKEKRKKIQFAEARTRSLWHAKQRLYPLSHEDQHTKSETKLSS